MGELLDELERVRDRQEKTIALLKANGLKPGVGITLDEAHPWSGVGGWEWLCSRLYGARS
jgi:hypothetical protein